MTGVLTYRGTVYPWQCDHIGHMNVMWYAGKFDEATWHFFASLGITPSYLRTGARGMGAVEQNITYQRELMPGDIVEITTRILEIRDKVVRFAHQMTNAETNEIVARCDLTAVHIDRTTRKSCPFSPEIRQAAENALREARNDA